MSDPEFFPAPTPIPLAEIVVFCNAWTPEGANVAVAIDGIGPLDRAGPGDITFFDNRRYATALSATRASACFCVESDVGLVPTNVTAVVTSHPHRAFALVAARLFPSAASLQGISGGEGVSPFAQVDATAHIEDGARIEPGAVVGPGAEIGRGTLVCPGAVVGPHVRIGRDCAIGAGATVTHALIGNRVIIHPGARIGQDGFGFVPGSRGHMKIVQIGRVAIQDDVEIGANTTIDRGSNRDTIVGEGTKIDNLVQIGHNVVIGRHCLIAGQVGISGSVTIGDFVMLGGNAGIRDNVTIGAGARVLGPVYIGDRVQIGANSVVVKDIPAGAVATGVPAKIRFPDKGEDPYELMFKDPALWI